MSKLWLGFEEEDGKWTVTINHGNRRIMKLKDRRPGTFPEVLRRLSWELEQTSSEVYCGNNEEA